MISEELLQQLEDVGFPLDKIEVNKPPNDYCTPNLGELIEACGDNLHLLERCFKGQMTKYALSNAICDEDGWLAIGEKNDFFSHYSDEAVARFYIEFHKK